jgi:hypothetical protein
MPSTLSSNDAEVLQKLLTTLDGCEHLRVRTRKDLLTLDSGEPKRAISHVRFRKISTRVWALECATHTGRWEPTPFTGSLPELMDLVTTTLPWTIAPID